MTVVQTVIKFRVIVTNNSMVLKIECTRSVITCLYASVYMCACACVCVCLGYRIEQEFIMIFNYLGLYIEHKLMTELRIFNHIYYIYY